MPSQVIHETGEGDADTKTDDASKHIDCEWENSKREDEREMVERRISLK